MDGYLPILGLAGLHVVVLLVACRPLLTHWTRRLIGAWAAPPKRCVRPVEDPKPIDPHVDAERLVDLVARPARPGSSPTCGWPPMATTSSGSGSTRGRPSTWTASTRSSTTAWWRSFGSGPRPNSGKRCPGDPGAVSRLADRGRRLDCPGRPKPVVGGDQLMAFIPTTIEPADQCPACGWHPIDCRCADDAELASEAEAQTDDEGER